MVVSGIVLFFCFFVLNSDETIFHLLNFQLKVHYVNQTILWRVKNITFSFTHHSVKFKFVCIIYFLSSANMASRVFVFQSLKQSTSLPSPSSFYVEFNTVWTLKLVATFGLLRFVMKTFRTLILSLFSVWSLHNCSWSDNNWWLFAQMSSFLEDCR